MNQPRQCQKIENEKTCEERDGHRGGWCLPCILNERDRRPDYSSPWYSMGATE
jgi:hypothetical protein